ncbi:MAG: hypothetical protein ACRD8A_06540 [Candidatus Acidiferrales bacterium]
MGLQHASEVGRVASFVSLVGLILGVLGVIVWFVQSIRKDPRDRVVCFEVLAFGTLFLGALVLKVFSFWWPLVLIWFALFFGFTGCVVYLGVTGWVAREESRELRVEGSAQCGLGFQGSAPYPKQEDEWRDL